ncbi:MAG: TlpA disulfide reductase family protein [Planctomycetota bacterium]
MKLAPHLILAAAVAPATAAFADNCSSCTACSTTSTAISAEAEKPSTRPALSADEMVVQLQTATSREEALDIAAKFVQAFPADERSAQLLYILAQEAGDQETKLAHYKTLVDMHGDTPFADMAKGSLAQLEKVGQPFDLTFTPLRGETPLSLQDDLKGKVVVIDFWATWCGPCVAEMPKMKELYAQYKDQGVEFIGISLDAPPDQGGKEKLMAYVEQNDIPWPQYYEREDGEAQFSEAWGVNAIPTYFIVDADGLLHSTEARGQLETLIPELIAQRDSKQASAQ